jgi:hypothetical protein
MFTALIHVHGIGHPHIGTLDFIDYGFGKDFKVFRLILVWLLAFYGAIIQKIIALFMTQLKKTIMDIFLSAPTFDFGI